jgi:hypothetical protein
MFHKTAKISGKMPIKSGTSAKGEWKIIVFSITYRYKKHQRHLWLTARGKKADLVNKLRIGDKVDVEFVPQQNSSGERIFTDLLVEHIELSATRSSWTDTHEDVEPNIELGDDLNLQKEVDTKSIQYNGGKRKKAAKKNQPEKASSRA